MLTTIRSALVPLTLVLVAATEAPAQRGGVGGGRPPANFGGGRGGFGGYGEGGGFNAAGRPNPYGGYATNGYTGGFSSPGVPYNGYGVYPPSRGPYGPNGGYGGGYGAAGYGAAGYGAAGYGYGGGGNYGTGGNFSGNQQNNYPYPVVVPYPYPTGQNGYGGGYDNGQYPPQQPNVPQKRFAPANSNYLYSQEGSTAFYATPPGPEASTDPAAGGNGGGGAPDASYYTPAPAPTSLKVAARVRVHVPPEAHLWFEGRETRTTGADRSFKSTPLDYGRDYLYDVKARWWEDGKPVVKTRTITVRAGEVAQLDLTADE